MIMLMIRTTVTMRLIVVAEMRVRLLIMTIVMISGYNVSAVVENTRGNNYDDVEYDDREDKQYKDSAFAVF